MVDPCLYANLAICCICFCKSIVNVCTKCLKRNCTLAVCLLTSHICTKPAEDLSQYTGEGEELLKGDMDSFARAFIAFLHKKQRLDEMHRTYERVERARMSMENRIMQMTEFFSTRKVMKFSEMIKDDDSPFNRVITFMSLLELLKQRSVTAEQKKRFGDITIKRVETGGSND